METGAMRALSRRAAAFTQAEVSRAIRGAKSAGLAISRVEIDAQGKIVLIADQLVEHDKANAAYSGWRSKHGAHAT